MKTVFLLLLLSLVVSSGSAAPTEDSHELSVRVVRVDLQGVLTAQLANISDHPVRVWRESNTWGYGRWRVLLIHSGHVRVFYQNPVRGFTRNVPTFDEIPAGSHLTRSFDLNEGDRWISSDASSVSLSKGDLLILVYDVPTEFGWADSKGAAATKNMHVWSGVVVGSQVVP